MHIPGIKVVMPATPYDAKGLLLSSIRDDNTVVYIEHKMLYNTKGPVPEEDYTIPIGQALSPEHRVLPYDHVSGIIEDGQSFMVSDCICKKEQRLLDKGCEHPLEVCLVVLPLPAVFDDPAFGRSISKQEAYAVLEKASEAGLVHMTANLESGHSFICNRCRQQEGSPLFPRSNDKRMRKSCK